MNKKIKYAGFLCLLLFLLIPAGCRRDKDDTGKTGAEEKTAKTKLAKVESALEKVKLEKDSLERKLSAVSENLRKTNAELTAVSRENEELLKDFEKLDERVEAEIARRNDAQQQAEKLKAQLEKELKNNQEYEQLVTELEGLIEGLERQIKGSGEQPLEKAKDEMIEGNLIEDTNEEIEVNDGNNV